MFALMFALTFEPKSQHLIKLLQILGGSNLLRAMKHLITTQSLPLIVLILAVGCTITPVDIKTELVKVNYDSSSIAEIELVTANETSSATAITDEKIQRKLIKKKTSQTVALSKFVKRFALEEYLKLSDVAVLQEPKHYIAPSMRTSFNRLAKSNPHRITFSIQPNAFQVFRTKISIKEGLKCFANPIPGAVFACSLVSQGGQGTYNYGMAVVCDEHELVVSGSLEQTEPTSLTLLARLLVEQLFDDYQSILLSTTTEKDCGWLAKRQ